MARKKNKKVHHIIPVSRGGQDTKENYIFIREKFHSLYHQIFENLTPAEILLSLCQLITKK